VNKSRSEARQKLLELNKRDDGVTVEAVIKEAESSSSPLHSYFEWDDSVAAREWRKVQARMLIQSFTIALLPSEDVRAQPREWVHVPSQERFRLTEQVVCDKGLLEEVASAMKSEIDALLHRKAVFFAAHSRLTGVQISLKSVSNELGAIAQE